VGLLFFSFVGARIGEIIRLEWRQVDLQTLRITLDPGSTKNNEGRTLPIYGDMVEWLRIEKEIRDKEHPECPYVFRRGGKPIRNFRKSWDTATALAGVPDLVVHDLRRSAVRNMNRAGVPEKIAMQVSGHKTRSVFDRYNIVNEGDLRLFAAKMEAHLESLKNAPVSSRTGTPAWTPTDFEASEDAPKKRISLLN
jgi:integrase